MDKNTKLNKPTTNRRRIVTNIVGLVSVFLLMAAAAIITHGTLLGHSFETPREIEGVTVNGDTTIVNTTETAKSISGYAGPVPVEIYIVGGKIDHIQVLDNSETPGFFKRVTGSGITDSWNGHTPEEALKIHIDAVSGATFSSKALIANVEAGLKIIADSPAQQEVTKPVTTESVGIEIYFAIAIILAAMIIPLFTKNKIYRTIQQLLNAGVLGFWSGTFVNYTMMLNVMANGLTALASLTTILMLIAAFIYPLFGKNGYYCAWVCPLGSLQELATKINPHHHIHIGQRSLKALTTFRMVLWGALMLCLWSGLFAQWIDYELFTAFLVQSAATAVLIMGTLFLVLSFFIPRPYCRFVCPTGTLLRMSQNIETK